MSHNRRGGKRQPPWAWGSLVVFASLFGGSLALAAGTGVSPTMHWARPLHVTPQPTAPVQPAVPLTEKPVPDPQVPTPVAPPEPPVVPEPEPPPVPVDPVPLPPDCAVLACVALTFDDGPGPQTGELLDVLASTRVKATFFVLGGAAQARPDIVARQVAEGHVVGNHSWDHKDLTKLSDEAIIGEMRQTWDTVTAATGVPPTMLRPPYGAVNPRVAGLISAAGYSTVLWNVDTEDWRNKDVTITTQRVFDSVKPGSIILMHDIHPTTIAAVPGIIEELRKRGFVLVTVPELMGAMPGPGAVVSARP